MKIPASNAKKHSNGDSCDVWEYPLKSDEMGIAKAKIHGRYPQQGMAMNSVSEQAYYVLAGSGTILYKTTRHRVNAGDVVHFPVGKAYAVEGSNLEVLVLNTPPWNPEQYHTK